MKRIISIVLGVVFAIVAVSCANNNCEREMEREKMFAYEIGGSFDSADGGLHSDEVSMWSIKRRGVFESVDAEEILSVEFDGILYKGKYWYSTVELFNTYQSDYYIIDNGWFSVNAVNNELTSITFTGINIGQMRADEFEQEAIRIASQYINTNEYTMTITSDEVIHYYSFDIDIAGYSTCASLFVGISTSGEVVTFSRKMIEEVESIFDKNNRATLNQTITNLGGTEGERIVIDKLKCIYPDLNNYDIKDKTVVILESGELGMVYTVVVNVEGESENGYYVSSNRSYILIKYGEI